MKMIDANKETLTERATLCYWVDIENKQAYDESEDDYEPSVLPILYNNSSPIISRISAISFVRTNPSVTTYGGRKFSLSVYMMDNKTGKEYSIYSGVDQSTTELENLETELMLYMRYGYHFYGWELVTDQGGDCYRVINTDGWLG